MRTFKDFLNEVGTVAGPGIGGGNAGLEAVVDLFDYAVEKFSKTHAISNFGTVVN